jgi:peptidoglycan/xylan/chitin deacetylase (PgdA/CDA1 family)
MIRTAFNILSPGGSKGRLSILIFHRVLPEIDPLFPDEPDAARFDQMMGWVKQWFNVIPLDQAVDALKAGTLPARAAAITFDDGYADNRTVALPILQKHGLPATFFIATGFLNGGRMWNDTIIESIRMAKGEILDLQALALGVHENRGTADKRRAIDNIIGKIKYLPPAERVSVTESIAEALGCRPPDDLMMTSDQVREMHAAGMQIGAHTIAHPILARLDHATARHEIAFSKTQLEELIGEPVSLFAYPNGKPGSDYQAEHASLVQELGFSAAVSTGWGAARASSDLFQLPRFTPWDRSRTNFASRLMRNLFV